MSSLELVPDHPPAQVRAWESRWSGRWLHRRSQPDALAVAFRRSAAYLHRSALLIALLAAWELAPRFELADPAFLPPLSDVLAAGWGLALNGQLYEHVAASLFRILGGFAIALVLFVPLGLAMGWYVRLGDVLDQLIEALRNTAPLALLPVFILLLGIGEVSKVTMVVYSCA
jgi:NitT/TauT family transport system permease protein